jgi:FkbM family methyltransferase
MAYHETNVQKFRKLIQNPRDNIGKIVPFIKSKIVPRQRDLYELVGCERYSKPYPNHEELLKLIDKRNGFFVQCGGNDGYFQDPTYYLEKFMGWKGIIVEPLPISRLCRRNRKNSIVVQSACVASDYSEKTISFIDCNAMSFVKDSIVDSTEYISAGEKAQSIKHREIAVPARTMQSIIDEQKINEQNIPIDLFVADIEGYELEALRGLDFEKNSPTKILLEIQDSDRLSKISGFLRLHGYLTFDKVSSNDYLFTKAKQK